MQVFSDQKEGAPHVNEATYDGAENAITVRSSALVTKKVPAAVDADNSDAVEPDANSEGASEGESSVGHPERPKEWKQVRQARHAPKKRAWSKSAAKKIKKHHKREQKSKQRR
jgi:hypothetical protein